MNIEIVYEYENGDVERTFKLRDEISLKKMINEFRTNREITPKCWIYYIYMMSWILCPNDIILTHLISALIEENEPKITILLRENIKSPNTYNIPSSNVSEKLDTEVLINDIEPFTFRHVEEIEDKSSLIEIPGKNDTYYVLDSDYIIEYIKSKLYKGETFFEISLKFENKITNNLDEVVFDKHVWTNYFVRNNINSEELLEFFSGVFETTTQVEKEITNLHNNASLIERLKIFIYDLLKFNNQECSNRLQSEISLNNPGYYFTPYYFTEDEIEYLLNFPTSSGLILKDLLDMFRKSKYEEGITEVCTSHDLAPIMYKTFNIKKGFDKDKNFQKNIKKFKKLG